MSLPWNDPNFVCHEFELPCEACKCCPPHPADVPELYPEAQSFEAYMHSLEKLTNDSVALHPGSWDGCSLELFVEDKHGQGKTVLHLSNRQEIVMSEVIGISPTCRTYEENGIVYWKSYHGIARTDGRIIKLLENSKWRDSDE